MAVRRERASYVRYLAYLRSAAAVVPDLAVGLVSPGDHCQNDLSLGMTG